MRRLKPIRHLRAGTGSLAGPGARGKGRIAPPPGRNAPGAFAKGQGPNSGQAPAPPLVQEWEAIKAQASPLAPPALLTLDLIGTYPDETLRHYRARLLLAQALVGDLIAAVKPEDAATCPKCTHRFELPYVERAGTLTVVLTRLVEAVDHEMQRRRRTGQRVE